MARVFFNLSPAAVFRSAYRQLCLVAGSNFSEPVEDDGELKPLVIPVGPAYKAWVHKVEMTLRLTKEALFGELIFDLPRTSLKDSVKAMMDKHELRTTLHISRKHLYLENGEVNEEILTQFFQEKLDQFKQDPSQDGGLSLTGDDHDGGLSEAGE